MSDTLVLNADAQPVSFLPLSVVQWKEAVMYMYHDKCTVLDWYDDWIVRAICYPKEHFSCGIKSWFLEEHFLKNIISIHSLKHLSFVGFVRALIWIKMQ